MLCSSCCIDMSTYAAHYCLWLDSPGSQQRSCPAWLALSWYVADLQQLDCLACALWAFPLFAKQEPSSPPAVCMCMENIILSTVPKHTNLLSYWHDEAHEGDVSNTRWLQPLLNKWNLNLSPTRSSLSHQSQVTPSYQFPEWQYLLVVSACISPHRLMTIIQPYRHSSKDTVIYDNNPTTWMVFAKSIFGYTFIRCKIAIPSVDCRISYWIQNASKIATGDYSTA